MSALSVETTGLTKRYGELVAVDDLDLSVRKGEVYGFLGPNGAGKTTTLRMLLGLVHPTSGTATVLGEQPGTAAGHVRVGGLVESPAFYPYLSGRRNLQVLARCADRAPSRVDAVLEQVALTDRAEDAYKGYSLGMKQRLGIAAALLTDPDLLILDEPTNGLDPQGKAEIRTLIRTIGQGERTVLLSSHVLDEVEQICDRVGVIQNGTLVVQGTVEELRGETELVVEADPLDQARQLLEALSGIDRVKVSDATLVVTTETVSPAEIAHTLVTNEVALHELRPVTRSLEDTFLELTRQPARTADSGGNR